MKSRNRILLRVRFIYIFFKKLLCLGPHRFPEFSSKPLSSFSFFFFTLFFFTLFLVNQSSEHDFDIGHWTETRLMTEFTVQIRLRWLLLTQLGARKSCKKHQAEKDIISDVMRSQVNN